MSGSRGPGPLGEEAPSAWSGVLVTLAVVAASTGLIYILRGAAPVVSLGVVYLPGILLISTIWGLRLGLLASVLSALAFNFFHIPPLHRFTIAEEGNWVALAAFVLVAVATSTVAQIARARAVEANQRRREADLLAALAQALLSGIDLGSGLAQASKLLSDAYDLPSASISVEVVEGSPRDLALPLVSEGDRVGTLVVPATVGGDLGKRLRTHLAPAVAALIAAAGERERLLAGEVRAEALRRSDAVKTTLLRAVSHDLRSPLTAIVAAGEALDSSSLGAEERHQLSASVVQESRRLAELVDNLLDLSRLEAGAAKPRRDWCSLEEIARAAADELGLGGDEVRLEVRDDLPMVRADAAQLQRALSNLLRNARLYSGGAQVLIRGARVGDRAVLRVIDRGPGIPHAEAPHVFDAFYRGEGGRRRTGSGLGLAIARGFVEANDGTISVESVPGQGSTFVLEFPAPAPAPAGAR
ncbi:MAG: DUF4118 domain-containing protein [Solirubrobacterales bacterium]